jgi:hypothetical protein
MDRFTRLVLGYHGCEPPFAERLVRGDVTLDAWELSQNPYDWLGHGIYFWEFAPERAKTWDGKGGVIGAVIQLGTCLDLTDVGYTALVAESYERVKKMHHQSGKTLPRNRGKRRDLDCLVINNLVEKMQKQRGIRFQTVRCPFLEGEPAFPGSGIFRESHVQIAVRDRRCILGVFRPNLFTGATDA